MTSSITGTKIIANIGFQESCLDVILDLRGEQIVGNPTSLLPLPGQRWEISEIPDKKPTGYVIYNKGFEKYLGYDNERLHLELTSRGDLWEIKSEPGPGKDNYKLEIYEVGTVCSLQSPSPGALVSISNFKGPYETWHFRDVAKA